MQKDGWLHNPDTGVFLEPGGQKLWFDPEASTREGFAAKMVSSESTQSAHFADPLAGSVGLYDTMTYTIIHVDVCAALTRRPGSTKNSMRLGANTPKDPKGHRVLKGV